ncbi:MAG: hypothetical protein LBN33_03220 [Desulfovibrio sp.]|nr:hypothetical protein [Desulfovibrio sp.]
MPQTPRRPSLSSFSIADLCDLFRSALDEIGKIPLVREIKLFFTDLYAHQGRKNCRHCGGVRCIRLCQLLGDGETDKKFTLDDPD